MNPALEQEHERLNQLVAQYDDSPFDRAMRHYMMRSLGPFLPRGRALELGCLYGEFTSLLAEQYDDLTVVDAAGEFLEVTRRRVGDKVKYRQSLFEDFEGEGAYDAVFLMHILEHLLDPVAVLKKAGKSLSDQGRVILVVPNGNAASRQIAVKMGILPHRGALSASDVKHGHRRVYFLDTLQRDALDAGLALHHSGGIFFKPLANFQFDALMGGPVISPEFMEGCYQLGKEHPDMCASIFVVCGKQPAQEI